MTKIIEPQERLATVLAESLQGERFAASHVGLEASQKYHAGGLAVDAVVRNGCTVVPC